MESFSKTAEKGRHFLPVLAMLGSIACTTEGTNQDSKMEADLSFIETQTDNLARKFEVAASKALANNLVFAELGDQSGEVVMVDNTDTFGCIKTKTGDGLLCEEAELAALSNTPNQVSIDRDGSTLVSVGGDTTGVQVLSGIRAGHPEDSATMFLSNTACAINTSNERDISTANTNNPDIVKKCHSLRDALRERLQKVMDTAVTIKKLFGN